MAKRVVNDLCVDGDSHNFDIVETTPFQNLGTANRIYPGEREIKLFCHKCAEIREIK